MRASWPRTNEEEGCGEFEKSVEKKSFDADLRLNCCGYCRYWAHSADFELREGLGECRRYAPRTLIIESSSLPINIVSG